MLRGSREPAAWLKTSFAAVVLLGGMILVMWIQQGPPLCAMSPESPRRLQLERSVDREHLAADNQSAERSARRFAASDADIRQRQRRFLECEAVLARAIATTHGLSAEQVLESASHTP
jgi:hypothetical protein